MATEIQLDTVINTVNSAKSLRELGKGLRELVSLQGQVGSGTADFKKLQTAINDTEGRIGDLNDSFSTLRGSGIERVNSSLGLFREGLSSADPGKLSIALDGLSTAMKAIPIFLVIEGAKLLFENWSKITAVFSSSAREAKANEEALRLLTIQLDRQSTSFDRSLILQEQELKNLRDQEAPLNVIISKLREIDNLKTSKITGELQKTDKEIQNVLDRLRKAQEDLNTTTSTQTLLQAIGISAGTTADDVRKIEDELSKLLLKRGETSNQLLALEVDTNNKITEEKEKANKKLRELEEERTRAENEEQLKRIRQKIANDKRIIQEQEQTDRELEEMTKERVKNIEVIEDASFLKSLERGKKEFEIEQNELNRTLSGRLELLRQAKMKELAGVTAGSKASLAIEKQYAELAFREKARYYNQYLELTKSGIDILNSYNALVSQNENYTIQQQQYAKDAELENNRNRTQELIDIETKRANDLIANESLTAEQIERIKFDSETRIREIQANSANQDLAIQQEFDKKALEIRRKQFEREKRIQLVTAGVNVAAAILSALATVQPYPAALVAAGAAAATGAFQIAKIVNQKFDDGGAGARTGIVPISTIDTRPAPSAGGGGNSGGGGGNFNANNTPSGQLLGSGLTTDSNGILQVVVLQGDIREAMSKVDVLENRATFGV